MSVYGKIMFSSKFNSATETMNYSDLGMHRQEHIHMKTHMYTHTHTHTHMHTTVVTYVELASVSVYSL